MSVSRHTTGPWHHEPTNSAKLTYVAVSTISGANGSTVVIGQCAGPDREGNARLIAAAPDLLEALKALVEEQVDYMLINNLGDPEQKHNIRLSRAAIAKATGET